MAKKKIAISCGDIQGVGLELILKSHKEVSAICEPLYLVHSELLERANQLLHNAYEIKSLNAIAIHSPLPLLNSSTIGKVSAQSGAYSFESFKKACELADSKEVDGICTLPINKLAWQQAQIPFVGHTDFLKQRYKDHQIIMMLGCSKLFVGLFSDHVPLSAVSQLIQVKALVKFLLAFQKSTQAKIVQVCGFNPHAGEEGLFGEEDEKILKAIQESNQTLGFECFLGPLPADSAFAPNKRKITPFYVSMSHDVGLAPLKALYFDESINVSLNAPILRASTDHGTAFDIAYQNKANHKSYLNAIKYLA
ncbi:4-hydroxythreonine-4-phosphate dehydrogenase [Helicobacter pylori Hp P-3]|uniref:4-hydroxythreonine-4-phosphate dehydrogenase n=1 Tax=Helicobacter pylori TaxID=210 RepID=UPI00026AED4A|nr:4-hydroxythreonine-4-phosphate dehydrogenase [Helicobacter pylori]EJC03047.1 4-hydroxythreonine-4-phosphate dehydrogenase [Helicobacter pylori Hp P-3]EJC55748.1 4-hydroxythreonine-4-phosphate dehydrogenase [Helicobacter pylori Hp P-3b]WQV45880.1 4-hydroxythreonine-4-phosphate dehydrogenase [Helicobacter pylori]WRA98364.1 4-hydroxythreonine-4-phosphate dehydrogenase [Helicobacter pylori]